MKLNATPRHYMPLSQNQSDEDESGPTKEDKVDKLGFKNAFSSCEGLSNNIRQSETDDVVTKTLPMSPLRILLFVLSLILCVLFVIIFVFFIPCSMHGSLNMTCSLNYRWQKTFLNLSFTSPLDFVSSRLLKKRLIIFGYLTDEESGLLAVQESTGKEQWRLPFHSTPFSSICNIIDVNLDGIPECLVIGSNGLLVAVDIKKGVSLWYLHNHSDINDAHSISGPLVVPDCDGDGILDVVISYNVSDEENISYLAVVSGGTGQIVGSLVQLEQCSGSITDFFPWEFQNETHIILYCGEKPGNLWMLSSSAVCNKALNETEKLLSKSIFRIPRFAEDVEFYKISDSSNQFIVAMDGSKFMVLDWTPDLNFYVPWKNYVDSNHHLSVIMDGQFVEGSTQLVISSRNASHSKVIGLCLSSGKEVWSFTLDGGVVVVSAVKLPRFFGDTDGLILKILQSFPLYEQEKHDQNPHNSSSNTKDKEITKNLDTQSLEENYVLVKCGRNPVMKTISTEEILAHCKGSI
ncbi:uncharacterized protein LOC118201997, partial [Stegodyphus dumicola]|uniref:uncharacterized protein LOC118201997 n=1 Tax=Stegodyphus dumicola TaxID=202533 RepID=UPI0015AFE869